MILNEVRKWMTFFGWSEGGNPGSVKRDVDGKVIAHSGDATWVKDVEDAIDRQEREAVRAEPERRSAKSRIGAS